jgi:hypothetical protein
MKQAVIENVIFEQGEPKEVLLILKNNSIGVISLKQKDNFYPTPINGTKVDLSPNSAYLYKIDEQNLDLILVTDNKEYPIAVGKTAKGNCYEIIFEKNNPVISKASIQEYELKSNLTKMNDNVEISEEDLYGYNNLDELYASNMNLYEESYGISESISGESFFFSEKDWEGIGEFDDSNLNKESRNSVSNLSKESTKDVSSLNEPSVVISSDQDKEGNKNSSLNNKNNTDNSSKSNTSTKVLSDKQKIVKFMKDVNEIEHEALIPMRGCIQYTKNISENFSNLTTVREKVTDARDKCNIVTKKYDTIDIPNLSNPNNDKIVENAFEHMKKAYKYRYNAMNYALKLVNTKNITYVKKIVDSLNSSDEQVESYNKKMNQLKEKLQ